MLYGVQVLNNLKGTNNLALFETEGDAEDYFERVESIWEGVDKGEEDMERLYLEANGDVVDFIENIVGNNLKEYMEVVRYYTNNDGKVRESFSDVYVIRYGSYVIIPH